MPTSDPENKRWVLSKINKMRPFTILDVGAGDGGYAKLIKPILPDSKIDGIEVWEPYIKEYNLESLYDNVIQVDVREHEDFNYDLVIFGDVLEHMSEADALAVWEKASKQAKWGIISIPIIHCPQGDVGGNPYEIHVEDHWTTERVLNSFSHIVSHKEYRLVGGFAARFKNNRP